MRLAVSLFILATALTAGTSPAGAQLPALPLPDVVKTVEETTKKTVDDTERVVRETVDRTVEAAPGSDGGAPGGGAPDDGGPGGGGLIDDGPGGGGPGGGGSDDGGSGPAARDSHECPDEQGVLGGGGGDGTAILAVSGSRASSGGRPSADDPGGADESADSPDAQMGLGPAVAAEAGPVVLAILALATLCLLIGVGGGLRALHGRIRGG